MQDISFPNEVNVDRFRLASLPSLVSSSHDTYVSLLTKNINTWIFFVLRIHVSTLAVKKILFSVGDKNENKNEYNMICMLR